MAKLFLYGKRLSSLNSGNFLCPRYCLVSSSQSISKKAQKRIDQDLLPPKPKKPMSSFLLFLRDTLQNEKQQHPGQVVPHIEIQKRAANAWAIVEPDVKERYRKRYQEQMEIFRKEMLEYTNSLTEEQKVLLKTQKKENKREQKRENQTLLATGKPTKPKSSFLLFLDSERSKLQPEQSQKNFISSSAKKWQSLSEEERDQFKIEATKLKAEYEKQLKIWKEEVHISELSTSDKSMNKSKK